MNHSCQCPVLSLKDPPRPLNLSISIKFHPGGLYAARVFNGVASPASTQQELSNLRTGLERDKVETVREEEWTLARYSEPSTPDILRRNEVLLRLNEDSFQQIWR
jgi:hypothetical protein